jgi:hypothetical protein
LALSPPRTTCSCARDRAVRPRPVEGIKPRGRGLPISSGLPQLSRPRPLDGVSAVSHRRRCWRNAGASGALPRTTL